MIHTRKLLNTSQLYYTIKFAKISKEAKHAYKVKTSNLCDSRVTFLNLRFDDVIDGISTVVDSTVERTIKCIVRKGKKNLKCCIKN